MDGVTNLVKHIMKILSLPGNPHIVDFLELYVLQNHNCAILNEGIK